VAGSVSVVIPCYNYGRYLRECVDSVLAQDVDLDVDIIDDASTDDSAQVCAALAKADPRVTFHRHVSNRGHIATYNEGLERARGTYSLLLSADDVLAPGALRRARDVLDDHPDVVLLYGDVVEFRDTPPALTDPPVFEVRIWPGQEFVAEGCREVWNPISTPGAVVRTSAQQAVGGYRPSLPHAGDREMWLRLATHGDVAELKGAVQAFYRLHDVNMHKQWFHDFLINEREFRNTYETFFRHSAEFVSDSEELRRQCARRLAERGIWWGYQRLRRVQPLRALECLRFSVSVWHDRPEGGTSLRNPAEVVAPVRYAVRERRRRRRHARQAPAAPSSTSETLHDSSRLHPPLVSPPGSR
jgi:glycosyltransferase involved in cell wall biosynthesis